MKSKVMVVGLAMALVLAVGSQALAIQLVTLTDGDSTVEIAPESSAGMTLWEIGDTNHLNQQWFWFRTSLGGVYDDREYSIDEISAPAINQPVDYVAEITYADNNIEAQVTYTLTDEPGLLGGSDLLEIVRVTNTSGEAMTLTFFQYSDFELGGDPTDTDLAVAANSAAQKDTTKGALMSETVVNLSNLVTSEVGYDSATLSKLTDGDIDNLDGTTLLIADGDMTWAFQWEKELGPGEALLFSKNKHISIVPGGDNPVPEPAGLGLVGVALLALRKRRK